MQNTFGNLSLAQLVKKVFCTLKYWAMFLFLFFGLNFVFIFGRSYAASAK